MTGLRVLSQDVLSHGRFSRFRVFAFSPFRHLFMNHEGILLFWAGSPWCHSPSRSLLAISGSVTPSSAPPRPFRSLPGLARPCSALAGNARPALPFPALPCRALLRPDLPCAPRVLPCPTVITFDGFLHLSYVSSSLQGAYGFAGFYGFPVFYCSQSLSRFCVGFHLVQR